VLFHYALVDDLISKEEFERRIDEKIDACGDLIDEPTAAMLVVGELGRQHVKIRGLSGRSSLFSFFAKVVDKTEPREFVRADGDKGWVATLLVGDETGTAQVVLWDEKAGAAAEIAPGDVLEIIGRHPKKSAKEIYALALRKATCRIECRMPASRAESLSDEPVDLDAIILALEEPRTFTRRDGSMGEMVDAVIGDASGTARLIAWTPEILAGISPGSTVHIKGAKPNARGEGRAYSIDEKSAVVVTDTHITVPFTPLNLVGDRGMYSVQAEVKQVQEPHAFSSRDGRASWVRNIMVSDGSNNLNIVLWGEHALLPVKPGDRVEIFNATAKPKRSGGFELGVGRGSAIRLPDAQSGDIVFEGTVIVHQKNTFIDNGHERYLLDGGDLPPWREIRVTGTVTGNRIKPHQWEPVLLSPDDILKKAKNLLDTLLP